MPLLFLYESVAKISGSKSDNIFGPTALHLSRCYAVSVHERAGNIKTGTQLFRPVG